MKPELELANYKKGDFQASATKPVKRSEILERIEKNKDDFYKVEIDGEGKEVDGELPEDFCPEDAEDLIGIPIYGETKEDKKYMVEVWPLSTSVYPDEEVILCLTAMERKDPLEASSGLDKLDEKY